MLDDRLQGVSEPADIQRLTRAQQDRLVPVMARGDVLLEEPVLNGEERHCSMGGSIVGTERRLNAPAAGCRAALARRAGLARYANGASHVGPADHGSPTIRAHLT